MKIILFLLLPNIAFAFGNYYPVGKSGANTAYSKKLKCEQVEGAACFSITNCPVDECSIKKVQGIDTLLPDASLIALKQARVAQENADKQQKKARLQAAKDRFKDFYIDPDTTDELKRAIMDIRVILNNE